MSKINNRKVAKKTMALEFELRHESGKNGDGGRDYASVFIPIRYAWQEGPDDLHVQLDLCDEALNLIPRVDKRTGDYLIPAKGLPEGVLSEAAVVKSVKGDDGKFRDCVLAYSMNWHGRIPMKQCVSEKYARALNRFWYSPNR